MNKLVLCLLIAPIFVFQGVCQSKELNYYDLEIGRLNGMKPDDLTGLKWRDNLSLVYVRNDSLFQVGTGEKQHTKLLLTLSELNQSLINLELDTLKKIPSKINFRSLDEFRFMNNSNVFNYNLKLQTTESIINLPSDAQNVNYSADYSAAVYTKANNLFLSTLTSKELQLSNDTLNGIVNGETVHRREFGIRQGSYWSPNGNRIAYYQKDESMVSEYPILHIDKRVAEVKEIHYPMAGMKSEEVKVKVYDLNSLKTVLLQTNGDPEQYLTNISWSPTEQEIYIQQLNREQNHMCLVKYNAVTGQLIDTLFEEKHDKYVEPFYPILFSKTNPLNFYYQSSRDGYNHVYLYNDEKKRLIQLTKGNWELTKLVGFDKEERNLFFMATKESPLERHLYRLNLTSLNLKRLTAEPGNHKVTFSKDYSLFIDKFSSRQVANKIEIRNRDGKPVTELLKSKNPLADYELGEVISGKIIGGDNKAELLYRLVLPTDFDKKKKYPVVFYVYGGPHVQLIKNSWIGRTELWQHYMAQQGFIGITIDTRGSDNRGMEFENVIHRQTGIPQMEDVIKCVEFMKGKEYVDTARIGIHGWSYGGYMAITMMTKYPEVFKVGVAGGPVVDWKYYEVMYGERYMDTPEENPEGYELTNLNNYAGHLKGKLKIIHGVIDPVVLWQHSLSFMQACVKAGTMPDYFMYPLHKHNVSGNDRKHLVEQISEYFKENL